jgi:hypothetical protein
MRYHKTVFCIQLETKNDAKKIFRKNNSKFYFSSKVFFIKFFLKLPDRLQEKFCEIFFSAAEKSPVQAVNYQ